MDPRIEELFEAIEKNDANTVERVINSGISPDAEWDGMSALMKAVALNNKPLVRLLLKLKADPNKIASNKMTPLTFAALLDFFITLEMVNILNHFGGDIHKKDGFGKNADEYIKENYVELNKYLRAEQEKKFFGEFVDIEPIKEEEWTLINP